MEVDEIQTQVSKYQRVCSNGSTTTTDNSSNPVKIATSRGNLEPQNHVDDAGGGGGVGGVARLCGWPSSRIVRVSRASGGKDRHSKVLTSKGLRDRRVRLSVGTAIQFYDLQDRLGYDQPSKAVEWLLKAASSSIDELPSLDLPIAGALSDLQYHQMSSHKKLNELEDRIYVQQNNKDNNYTNVCTTKAKSPSCSSTSETSKGSGLSLSRSENRIKARERARGITASKKEIDSTGVTVSNQVINNSVSENSSFTDLLTGGINTTNATAAAARSPMEYLFNRPPQFQLPQFNITTGDNLQQFSFLQDNLNFPMTSSSGGGFTRGTLQSNLPSSILPHQYHHLQRFQSSSMDGSAPANLPFFIVPNTSVDHFPAMGGYHFSYCGGGDGSGRHSDHHKDKSKN